MKTFTLLVCLSFLLASCKDETTTPPNDNNNETEDIIKGLELTYLPINNNNNFQTIYFVDESTGYVGNYKGMMFKTNDGGKTWIELPINIIRSINAIFFLDKNEGFAVGPYEIIHTKDGGNTWEKVATSNSMSTVDGLRSICFVADNLGFAVGDQAILSTKDKGVTWKETKIDVDGTMVEVKFFNDKTGIIACTNGKLVKTTDGGLSWNVSSPAPLLEAYRYSLVNENLIFSFGSNGLVKSTDFGNTWNELPSFPVSTRKLIFISEHVGYSLGSGKYTGGDWGYYYGAIYYTTDGGTTWEGSDELKEIGIIISACFLTENLGYAVSGNKVIKIRKR